MTPMQPIAAYAGEKPTAYDLAVAQYYKGGSPKDAGSKLSKEQALMSQVEAAKKDSQLAGNIMGKYLPPGVAYAKGPGAPASGAPQLAPFNSDTALTAIRAAEFEKAKKAQMASEENIYDKAYSDSLQAAERARLKAGVFKEGSIAQQVIGGGVGAGVEKTGKYKNIYGEGSMLPALWMQNKFNKPDAVASKLSGIKDRGAAVTGQFESFTPYSFERGGRRPAKEIKKTGLGKYTTLSDVAFGSI
jgi:hypothetical protein